MAVAAGPVIGGAVTTFASCGYVFVGEVLIVLTILPVLRKVEDDPPARVRLDYWGSALSIVGLGMRVNGAGCSPSPARQRSSASPRRCGCSSAGSACSSLNSSFRLACSSPSHCSCRWCWSAGGTVVPAGGHHGFRGADSQSAEVGGLQNTATNLGPPWGPP